MKWKSRCDTPIEMINWSIVFNLATEFFFFSRHSNILSFLYKSSTQVRVMIINFFFFFTHSTEKLFQPSAKHTIFWRSFAIKSNYVVEERKKNDRWDCYQARSNREQWWKIMNSHCVGYKKCSARAINESRYFSSLLCSVCVNSW